MTHARGGSAAARVAVRCALAMLAVLAVVLATACAGASAAGRPYSYDEAWRYHYYIRALYCEPAKVDTWQCGPVCESVPGFQAFELTNHTKTGVSGFLGVDHAHAQVVVGFRCSNNVQNFFADVSVKLTPYDRQSSCGTACQVHTGFYSSYLSVQSQVVAATLDLLRVYPTYEILVTGHSLGGALAVLAAADLQQRVTRLYPTALPVAVYTFGAPRVGNPAFARWVSGLLARGVNYRITHGRDPVVRLPLASWGYAHSPGEVFYKTYDNSSMRLCVDTVDKQDPECSASMLSVSMFDHAMYLGETTFCECSGCEAPKEPGLPLKLYAALAWEFAKHVFS